VLVFRAAVKYDGDCGRCLCACLCVRVCFWDACSAPPWAEPAKGKAAAVSPRLGRDAR